MELEPKTEICFRELDKSEYNKLEHIFALYGDAVPHQLSSITVAEIGNEIIGFCSVTMFPMITMYIDEKFRSTGLWLELVQRVQDLPVIQQLRTYVICSTPQTEEMCKRMGLTKIEHPVYMREV